MEIRLQTSGLRVRDFFLGSFVFLAAAQVCAGDWPQYRGPNHDGISTETIRTNWSEEAPRQIWKVPLDPGLSSFSISGGRAFTLVRRSVSGQDQEFCVALNADTGHELWASDPLGRAYYPDGGVGIDDGPRSTPSVDGDRVYVLTSYLGLYCLSITNGAILWSKDIMSQYGSDDVDWQSAASPLIEGDRVFVFANAPNQCLLAFHKSDGSEAWRGQNDVMTQASPIAATIAGVRQVIFFARSGLVSVVPETGAVLWRYPFRFSLSTAASPVVGGDVVYCSAAYGGGAGTVRITNSGGQLMTNEVWRIPFSNRLMNHWATPVFHDGYLFGIYGQQDPTLLLRCVDFANGVEKWNQSGVGNGGVLSVSGHVLVLAEDGNLLLVKPDPAAYTEVARYRALDGSSNSIPGLAVKCWNVPAISNGRVYVRSTTEAVCLDVTQPLAPLKLFSTLASGTGLFQLLIGNADGTSLDTNRPAGIAVFASTDLTLGLSGWIRLNSALTLTNGQLFLDDEQSAATAQRFFRVEARP
jgi:outer membrane protein assembly factor BamB